VAGRIRPKSFGHSNLADNICVHMASNCRLGFFFPPFTKYQTACNQYADDFLGILHSDSIQFEDFLNRYSSRGPPHLKVLMLPFL